MNTMPKRTFKGISGKRTLAHDPLALVVIKFVVIFTELTYEKICSSIILMVEVGSRMMKLVR